jgi:cytochrome-b5 reductase
MIVSPAFPNLFLSSFSHIHVRNRILCVVLTFSTSCYRGIDTDGTEVVRPYTPTTLDSDVGFFDLVVKVRSQAFSHGQQQRQPD